ncbi:hydantoinase/carbamoylase family amidase [candidate division GN15 bacterium]|nr:hydantoinase/carbamoylase family amidase [candidate division GN15 bacterium]
MTVNIDRLQDDLETLAAFGRAEDRGIYRMAFTEADMLGRRWLRDRIEAAGMESVMDGAGNVFGRLNGRDDAPALIIGSHLDTVPAGGPLDGALGVLCGLECLRRIREEGLHESLPPVELVAFSDEEGRFSGGLFGSRALTGALIPQMVHDSIDLDGVRLVDAMTAVGLDPMEAIAARRHPESIRGYLELHIEQGPVLDSMHTPVGVVENITGLYRWQVHLIGNADHAGTTPMGMRRDSLMGLAEFAGEIPRILEENGSEDSVATIGNVVAVPGSPNTVPGQVDFTLDVRDPDPNILSELGDTMRRVLSAIGRRRDLMFEFEVLGEIAPVPCDSNIVSAIARTAEELDVAYHRMHSGAAHDAQIMAAIAPIGMIFVPSKEGRSHSNAEWTHMEDIRTGANVLLNTVLRLSYEN